MTDFVFTITTALPGTILVEVNMAGNTPGDVGFFNCHFSIGWLSTSHLGSCTVPASCQAAHACAHFTPSSSVCILGELVGVVERDAYNRS